MQQFLTELYLYLEACHSVDVFACVLDIDMFLTRMTRLCYNAVFCLFFCLFRSVAKGDRRGRVT